jgi:hypothetical protein
METRESLYGKLLYSKDVGEMMLEDILNFDLFDMNQAMIEDVNQHFNRFFDMAKSLIEHKFVAARRLCAYRDNFSWKSNEISSLRYDIKYLISGLYIASNIRNHYELEILRSNWKKYSYADCDATLNPLQIHLKTIYSEFNKIETLIDAPRFAEFFNQYVINLVFDMVDLSLSKLDSTIVSFRSLNSFEYFCSESEKQRRYYVNELRRVRLYNQSMS